MFISKLDTIFNDRKIKKTRFALEHNFPKTFIENLVSKKFRDINTESLERVMQILGITKLEDIIIYLPFELEIHTMEYTNNDDESYILGLQDIEIEITLKSVQESNNKSKSFKALVRVPNENKSPNIHLPSIGSLEDIYNREEWIIFFSQYDKCFSFYVAKQIEDYVRKEIKLKDFIISRGLIVGK